MWRFIYGRDWEFAINCSLWKDVHDIVWERLHPLPAETLA